MVHCLDGDVAGHTSIDDMGGAAWWSCRARCECEAILAVVVGLKDVVVGCGCWCQRQVVVSCGVDVAHVA